MKIIAVDIGNSSIDIGFFAGEDIFILGIGTRPSKSPAEYESLLNKFIKEKNIDKEFEGGIISSVVPGYTRAVGEAVKSLCKTEPLILTHKFDTGLILQVDEPDKLGTDRIAAAAGACALFGAPVAVVDFGTATTVNFIARGNAYKGGTIMPGLGLMKKALSKETAQLPDVDISAPLSPLGKDTRGNILSGIIYGTAGAVERIISEAARSEGDAFKVVLTGGYSSVMSPFLNNVDYIEPALVLKGLKAIYIRVCRSPRARRNS